MSLTLHLNQELRFDTTGSLTLILTSGATQGVNLIYEDDGRLVFPRQAEQSFHQSGELKIVHFYQTVN